MLSNNQFTVSLPFSDSAEKLGSSAGFVKSRFYALERKLARNGDLRKQYTKFMKEYLDLGHMKEVNPDQIPHPHYFLPHHCVLKPDSTSTKLRVVLDASAKTSTNVSLNDILHVGPTVQDELFTILLRFRLPKFAFKADIQMMYRQIRLQEGERRFHLIWWREDSSLPLRCYELCTVTYGTSSAPYLATRCLEKLASENATKYPLGCEVLRRDFYMDDLMSGANNLTTAKEIQRQLVTVLKKGGFKLRKWSSNHNNLLQEIPSEDLEVHLNDDNEASIKTLGLIWLPRSDVFQIKVNPIEQRRATKRAIASEIAQSFDPLGVVAPVIMVAQLFLQELWALKYDWDPALPLELQTRWCTYREGLQKLDKVKIPRHVFAEGVPTSVQIHTFADATEKAYGAAAYVRSTKPEGTVISRLLCSRSRVAPIAKMTAGMTSLTIPRLELCAAVLAAELASRIKADLKIEGATSYLWTDSQIVLCWIHGQTEVRPAFVGRRIARIHAISNKDQWRHVKTANNPADVLSRGTTPDKLLEHYLWFYGPLFLHGREALWPSCFKPNTNRDEAKEKTEEISLPTEPGPEQDSLGSKEQEKVDKIVCPVISQQEEGSFVNKIEHSNSFQKLQRVTAYCFRFIKLLRNKDGKTVRPSG
ncbi:uncharacterized protein LOC119650835 [Hermetia illucens]|uniref:uncharacterized protein LOC119650835 n=1 Tax=Hermetia illucens TaxID=343691 RepID=UPI0018CC4BD1|nr:uncharacterized protein LOC119650835 [Hermetia illucens]